MFYFKSLYLVVLALIAFICLILLNTMNLFMELKMISLSNYMNNNFFLTNLSCWFILIVSVISLLIYMYSGFYMGMNKMNLNFCWILLFFVLSMITLILSNSMPLYLLGWDGLGVSSFLLIVYYKNMLSTRSALATFITNRLGDLFIIMSMIIMMNKDFLSMNQGSMCVSMESLGIILMIMGASTKSAQIPFSAWLPAAMAAPTPVSALVHSSTLVTAGIFLMSNFSMKFFMMNNYILIFLSTTSILLSLISGIMAFCETDFKKMVAMSTLSQLGLMAYVLMSKNIEMCLFHIFSHASFKSLLFLVVGFLIFCNKGLQDTRMMSMPKTMMMTPMILFMASSMSLFGFLYTPGFFSKDMIICNFLSQGNNMLLHALLILSCITTAIYTMKSFSIILNNFLAIECFNTDNSSMKFMVPTTYLYMGMMMFGMMFFNISFDAEPFVLEAMNKIMGVIIIVLGMLIMRVSCSPLLQKIKNPTTKNNKDLNEYFLSMTNMNWLSNYLITKNYKTLFISKVLDNLEMVFLSENFNKLMKMVTEKSMMNFKMKFSLLISMFSVMLVITLILCFIIL